MTAPLSDAELAAIREKIEDSPHGYWDNAAGEWRPNLRSEGLSLLAEVDRQMAEILELARANTRLVCEVDRLRARGAPELARVGRHEGGSGGEVMVQAYYDHIVDCKCPACLKIREGAARMSEPLSDAEPIQANDEWHLRQRIAAGDCTPIERALVAEVDRLRKENEAARRLGRELAAALVSHEDGPHCHDWDGHTLVEHCDACTLEKARAAGWLE